MSLRLGATVARLLSALITKLQANEGGETLPLLLKPGCCVGRNVRFLSSKAESKREHDSVAE